MKHGCQVRNQQGILPSRRGDPRVVHRRSDPSEATTVSNGATPNTSVPSAVPSSVANSADNSVQVLTSAQLGPYQPQTGSSINPKVPNSNDPNSPPPPQPTFTGGLGQSCPSEYAGSKGAPSVPTDGFLFRAPPIDPHYMVETETRNPYATTGRPGTRGWWTRVQSFANHIAYNQNTTNTGFKVNGPQQRTSVMLNALPPQGEFGTQSYIPTQQPQAVRYNRIRPSTGSDPYGSGVLNNDTYGAGQTAGGIGGSNYTPYPAPPPTNSLTTPEASPEATWG